MSYQEPDTHINDKVKKVLNLSNYATKNELNDAASVGISNLAASSDFAALKVEVYKLDSDKLVNVPTSLNNL